MSEISEKLLERYHELDYKTKILLLSIAADIATALLNSHNSKLISDVRKIITQGTALTHDLLGVPMPSGNDILNRGPLICGMVFWGISRCNEDDPNSPLTWVKDSSAEKFQN